MAKKLWLMCVFIALSVHCAYAVENYSKASATSVPLIKDPVTSIELVYVKGGCYQMGATDDDVDAYSEEFPLHEVCISDFYLGKYEVTQGQWKSIMGSNASASSACDEANCPVDTISWNEVQIFIDRLNSKYGGHMYRLPTEAEWEYAARSGGKREAYSGGNNLNNVAWYGENSGRTIHPVGTKAPNGLGIYDMTGNVWEWTNDWYGSEYYKNSPRNNPAGPSSSDDRVVRGGCVTGEAANQRVSRRNGYAPDYHKAALGFRLLRSF